MAEVEYSDDDIQWACEWCETDPNDTAAKHPTHCKIVYCKKCSCKTWHWPKVATP